MSKVKIVARIRPFLSSEVVDDSVSSDGLAISLIDSRNSGQRLVYKEFAACYDYTNANEDPKDLFNMEIEPILDSVYAGKTLAILCYGVTSSGKTTTMQGNAQVPGIVTRSLEKLLQGPSTSVTETEYQYTMQYFEVYCDDCYDLLVPQGTSEKLSVREDKSGRVTVAGLSSPQFSTMEEFDALVKRANKARKTAATAFNRSSSRSHALLSVTVFQAPPRRLSHTHLPRMLGRIEFIDLAGSERNKSSDIGPAPKTRLAESASINKSLTALSRVVTSLNNNSTVIPYRDSTLTRVLKDALGGKSITLLVCNIAPGVKWLSHTRATIEFATKAKTIKSVPKTNEKEESKKRAEQKRHVDAEVFRSQVQEQLLIEMQFNLAVEAEVARRLAAMAVPPPPPPPQPISQEQRADSPPPVANVPEAVSLPVLSSAIPEDPQEQFEPVEFNYDEPDAPEFEVPEIPEAVEDLPGPEPQTETVDVLEVSKEKLSTDRRLRSKGKAPRKEVIEPSSSSSTKPSFSKDLDSNRAQDAEEEKQRYRRKLTKGLKHKHEEYKNSALPIDQRKYAKACIIAGKMALDERDDVELAISMFEKAISWYPHNERLLEETLKLKRRLRGEQGDAPSSGFLSVSSEKTPAKADATPNPLASTRNGNSREDKGKRREMFHFDVAKEEARQSNWRDRGDDSPQKKKSSQTNSRNNDSKSKPGNGKGKGKRKERAVITAAAAAFADSDDQEEVEEASQESEVEVEKSLQMAQAEVVPSPSPVKKKNTKKGRKRKSGESDEGYGGAPAKVPAVPKESPPKRRRIIF